MHDDVIEKIARTMWEETHDGSWDDDLCVDSITRDNYRFDAECALKALRDPLRVLVDLVWNEATESKAVPFTKTADRLIDTALCYRSVTEGKEIPLKIGTSCARD